MKADPHPELTRQYEKQRERCKPLTCAGNESCWVKRGVVVAVSGTAAFFSCCAGTPAVPIECRGLSSGGARIVP